MKDADPNFAAVIAAPRTRQLSTGAMVGELADHLGAVVLIGLGMVAALATFNGMT